MRRFAAILLIAALALSLAACSGTAAPAETATPAEAPVQSETPAPTAKAEPSDAAENPTEGSTILIAYFSHTGENYNVGVIDEGNTEKVAKEIAAQTGGDLFEIETVKTYIAPYKVFKVGQMEEELAALLETAGAKLTITVEE